MVLSTLKACHKLRLQTTVHKKNGSVPYLDVEPSQAKFIK